MKLYLCVKFTSGFKSLNRKNSMRFRSPSYPIPKFMRLKLFSIKLILLENSSYVKISNEKFILNSYFRVMVLLIII